MSIEKFKRILKIILAEHIYRDQDFFFIHSAGVRLCSKKEFHDVIRPKIENELEKGIEEVYGPNHFESGQSKEEFKAEILKSVFEYNVKRRHWFKAFEILSELVTKAFKLKEIKRKTVAICNQIKSKDTLKTDSKEFLALERLKIEKQQQEQIAEIKKSINSMDLKVFKY